ncbi:MAG: hypothetical protein KatS3mg121_0587 [Gammaproteobacteria bacterium]|nr:MAG: hypothetical protein KatS3mg121_0587 [Gammaproteobacteria bacterium]
MSAVCFEALPNGLRLAWLRAAADGVAVGLWWFCGTREEADGRAGWTHLLEHCLLRPPAPDSPLAAAAELDGRSGYEHLRLQAWLPADRAAAGLSELVERFLNPPLDAAGLAAERRVIAAEAAAERADPDRAFERGLRRALWGAHPLARPAYGRLRALAAADEAALRAFHGARLDPARLLLCAVGPLPEAALRAAAAPLAALPPAAPLLRAPPAPFPAGGRWRRSGPSARLAWLAPAPPPADPAAAAWALALALLDGPAGLLAVRLRAARLPVWALQLALENHSDQALAWLQAAAPPGVLPALERVLRETFATLAERGPDVRALAAARARLQARLAWEAADPWARAERLGLDVLCFGRPREPTEWDAALAAVDPAAKRSRVRATSSSPMSASAGRGSATRSSSRPSAARTGASSISISLIPAPFLIHGH